MPASGTEAAMAPFLRQIEQSQRRGSTIPSGKLSSSTTAPQWQRAWCIDSILVGPTCLIMAFLSAAGRVAGFNRSGGFRVVLARQAQLRRMTTGAGSSGLARL